MQAKDGVRYGLDNEWELLHCRDVATLRMETLAKVIYKKG